MRLTYLALLASLTFVACSSGTSGLSDGGPPDGSSGCQNDDQCPLDQHCDDLTKVCVAGSGNDCTADEMCMAGQACVITSSCGASRCHGNHCQQKTCTRQMDCAPNAICQMGKCVPEPACGPGDPACPMGTVCSSTTSRCEPGTSCTRRMDCPMGQTCQAGTCTDAQGCTTSAECPADQRCNRMVCGPPCTSNNDCGGLSACNTNTGECQARCLGDNTCPMAQICEMNLCVAAQCTSDTDCTAGGMMNRRCDGEERMHGRCVDFVPCTPGQMGNCPANNICNAMGQCEELPTCIGDRNCAANEYCADGHCQPSTTCSSMSCPSGQTCIGERCVPTVCRGPTDCPTMGQVCIGGVCQLPPPPTSITRVQIITPAGVVRPGGTYAFTAIAFNQAGDAVPGVTFIWVSTSTAIATIDATGVATGQSRAGTTMITASVDIGGGQLVTSPPVSLTNLGILAAGGLRVVAVAEHTGLPVSGATVELRDGATALGVAQTDMRGVALIPGIAANQRYDVTVASSNYDFVTAIGLSARDITVALPTRTGSAQAAGVSGTVDLSSVSSTGPVGFSLSGSSFASPLVGTDPGALFGGEFFRVQPPIPQIPAIPLPADATLSIDFMGVPFNLKDHYYARTVPGTRAAWCFGGKLNINLMGGGMTNPGDILGAALPYFQVFEHSVRQGIISAAVPTVADTMDIDGDGNSTELVPDWANFPTVAHRPHVAQSLRVQMVVNNARLPFVENGNANALIVMSGTILPGSGFVPLGLDGLQDDNGSGVVPSFTTRIAPAHDGLEVGNYAVMAMAIRIVPGALPGPGSTRLFLSSTLPTAVDFSDGWIDAPRNTEIDHATRAITQTAVSGSDLVRVVFHGPQGSWHVFAASNAAITVPPPPTGFMDLVQSSTATIDAIDLETGASADLVFTSGSGGARALDGATRGFSRGGVRWR
ncbi:MAG: hypothetical protein U1E65_14045 [Myxococcota bacterium]